MDRLVEKINLAIDEDKILKALKIKVTKFQYLKKSQRLRVLLKGENDIDDTVVYAVKKIVLSNIGIFDDCDVLYSKDLSNITLEELTNNYWSDFIHLTLEKKKVLYRALSSCEKVINNEDVKLIVDSKFIFQYLHDNRMDLFLKEKAKELFGVTTNFSFSFDEKAMETYIKDREEESREIISKVIKSSGEVKKEAKSKDNNQSKERPSNPYIQKGRKSEPKDENTLYGKKIVVEEITKIADINMGSGYVTIKGDLFKIDVFETKAGRKIISLFVTDYTSSIIVKVFPKGDTADELLENIKKGMHLILRGEAAYDSFAREVTISCRDINLSKKVERMDTATEKRVELHLHSTMSAMDGITSISRLVERAAKWGHKAIALTDHGVVQGFPEAMDAARKNNIKMIYGVEGYVVNDGEPIVINPEDKTIDSEFVVFDIETTGFSSINDKIIEIGAVKVKDGNIVDRFSHFVNPEVNIPAKIIELTGITDDMVKDADTVDIVLKNFREFTKGAILVAHNAPFDTSFIKKNYKDLGIEFDNGIMDTIPLSKFLYPDLKRYKLNVICKHLGISLENHHRAVDDAEATAEILLHSFKVLKEDNISLLSDLNNKYISNTDVKKLPSHHIIIFAINQLGCKNLYKLISKSNLEYFFRTPRMPKSEIASLREGLLIGSACEAGEVYKEIMLGRSDEEMEKIISFYDYLEIQPVGNNQFMIEKGIVKDFDELREINKRIYRLGKKYNKPVVATGDVHFLDPEDSVFRKILMAGKGFSDAENQPPLYLKTTNEMLDEFSYLGREEAYEVVVKNPNNIADMVEMIKPIPDETFPPKIDGAEEELREMTLNKVHSIYGDDLPDIVQKRLDKELNSIINNGYAVLYLIAQKLVAKSYSDGYLVGSRGSVGSSFVATMSGITEVNGLPPHYVCPKCKYSHFFDDGSVASGADLPDKECPKCGTMLSKDGHDIPFETFLGFEGDKEPDIDLNFSGDNQGDIHKYCEVLFGEGHTFKAGTIGTIADKTAYGFVKKYLDEKEIIVSSAEIERLSQGCTGVKRTTGQHPGGIMVVPADNEIYNFTPVQRPADDPTSDIVTTHFDYHSISGRLLKLDILGHDDPTVLRMLQDLTGVDPKSIPLGDPKVMSLFTSPESLGLTREELECEVGSYGLPEFGTKFVRQMLVDTQPQTFADIVRISGLSHGTDVWLNNAQYFIKEGYTTLKDCIATRDDIMVYLIYQGLPPKEAFNIMEKVRKGKGLSEENEELMREKNVPDWYIESCKRIKYMFPKGHAVAYCMMAVRIAYFKVYYPRAYYATYFTVRGDDFDGNLIIKGEMTIKAKIDEFNNSAELSVKDKGLLTTLEICYEMYKRGIKFLKVDIYKSDANKFIIEDDSIRMPISALNGVGENAAKSIFEAAKDGEFISKEDLRTRAKVSKTVIETLDEHGCLEGLPDTNQLSLFSL